MIETTHAGSLAQTRPAALNPARLVGRAILYLAIATGALIFAMPFVWMVSTSVKPGTEVYLVPPKWIPSVFEWQNYVEPWQNLPFLDFYKNSIIVTGVNIVATLVSSSMTAFAFARLRFRGRGFLFLLVLSTMMLPQQVTLIPLFILYKQLGWLDTFLPLIVPTVLGGAPFYIFLLRQFFMGIPKDFEDAARIDGATSWGILTKIFLPLSKPALASVVIFAFMFHWNDFFHPLIYLNQVENFTVPLGLQLLNSRYSTQVQQTMAMTLISVIPMLAVFFVAQARYIQGLTVTGVKG